jgi:hypothetical protein
MDDPNWWSSVHWGIWDSPIELQENESSVVTQSQVFTKESFIPWAWRRTSKAFCWVLILPHSQGRPLSVDCVEGAQRRLTKSINPTKTPCITILNTEQTRNKHNRPCAWPVRFQDSLDSGPDHCWKYEPRVQLTWPKCSTEKDQRVISTLHSVVAWDGEACYHWLFRETSNNWRHQCRSAQPSYQ